MDAIQRKCLACGESFIGVSRRQKYCSQECRPSAQNASDGSSYRKTENPDLSCLQPIENIDAGSGHFQEFEPSLPHANSSKELHFEEWPPRKRCVTHKLTDGQQINTGYGRASRALGYVMEIWPGKWVARVRNVISLPSSLTRAKQAALDLYRSRGEPKDWIKHLNQIVAKEIDRAVIQRERRRWPVDVMGGHRHVAKRPTFPIDPKLRQAILDTELADKPNVIAFPSPPLGCHEDGYPVLPTCLDRRPKETA
jgi:hypothetical protein